MELTKLDRAIQAIAPGWGLERAKDRRRIAQLYDAGKTNSYHTQPSSGEYSPDAVVDAARGNLRAWARHLEENYDIAISVLDDLVNATVGSGLIWDPQIRGPGGELHDEANDMVRELWAQFWEYPEVTRELAGEDMEKLIARSWLRDGEMFTHHVMGTGAYLEHASPVPYSLECLEADFVPYELHDDSTGANIVHGVEKNAWGMPTGYRVFRHHPGDDAFLNPSVLALLEQTKRVDAARITHLKFSRRLRQTRGVTVLHGVIHRLDDLRDMDESERIAQRIQAAFTAAITKDADSDVGEFDANTGERTFTMAPGQVWDDLLPGEKVEIISANRPNPNLVGYRADNIRAVAAGTGAGYSPISRHFDTSYAAQRAESVQQQPYKDAMSGYFCRTWAKPVFSRFMQMSIMSRALQLPQNIDKATVMQVDIRRGGGTPWVDPKADIEGDTALIDAKLVSKAFIQRKRAIPRAQMEREIEREREAAPEAEAEPEPEQEVPPNE